MNIPKLKINAGVASVILVAAYLFGASTLFTAALFIFCFCEVDDKIQNTAVKVFTFFIGITIVTVGWDLIVQGIGVVLDVISKFFAFINSHLDYDKMIQYTKFTSPINSIVDIADEVIGILITLAKLAFVVSIITNKPSKPNFVSNKINQFVNSAINWVQGITGGQPAAAPETNSNPNPAPNPQPTNPA